MTPSAEPTNLQRRIDGIALTLPTCPVCLRYVGPRSAGLRAKADGPEIRLCVACYSLVRKLFRIENLFGAGPPVEMGL